MHRRTRKKSKLQNENPKALSAPKYYLSKTHFLVLIGFAIVICIMRFETYSEPFERDIASHAVIGHELLDGRSLYSDLWDSKPPAIFITYAVCELLAGYGPSQVYFLGVTAAIITLLGIYRAASSYGGIGAGLWAAAFWTFICSDLWLWANQPNIEVCMNAAMVWAFALMLRADVRKVQPLRWVAIGGLFAIATLYKPVAIAFGVLLAAFYFLPNLSNKYQRKVSFFQICIAAATGAAIWGGVFAYFGCTGRLGVFYETVFAYGRYYTQSRGGNVWKNIMEGFSAKRLLCLKETGLFSRPMKSIPVLMVLSIGGIVAGLFTRLRRNWLLLFGFLLAAPLAISLPGRFYPHYYQLWLCPLVIGSGWAITSFGPKDKTALAIIRNGIGVVALVILVCTVLPQYKFTPQQWSANKYGPQFQTTREIAKKIDEIFEPDDTLYVWGINPELYFWTKRRPPTGLIWSTDLIEGPLAEEHTKRVLEDLEKAKPKIVAVNMLQLKTPNDHPVILWVIKNYQPLAGKSDWGTLYNRPFFRIMVRKTAL